MNKKIYMGMRLRRLRAQRGMSQSALAQALELSPSYVNQIEQNQRPISANVLLRLQALGVDVRQFSGDEEAGLAAALQEALADAPEAVTWPELQEVAEQMPAFAGAVLALHRRNVQLTQELEALTQCLDDRRGGGHGGGAQVLPHAAPYEEVRDFFFAHQNYFDSLDRAAEELAQELGAHGAALVPELEQRLHASHSVHVERIDGSVPPDKRRYDPDARRLTLSARLSPGQQAFQMGTQLALLEFSRHIDELVSAPELADAQAKRLARIGLANYAAGALLLPYGAFQSTAEGMRHDIERLGQYFGVGFETICHRLSTMQRPGAPGVPFFFVRVDRAGNISKRQSATHFHFSRTGGACPLWNVYEAFEQRGRILVQLAGMPDGRRYLWIARSVTHGHPGWGQPRQQFSIGLGCDVRHAHRLVYARGLDLKDPAAATPIGMGCRVCERSGCTQRAFPFAARLLRVDENTSAFAPYGDVGEGR